MEEGTAEAAEVFTVVAVEAADFMGAVADFTAEEDSPAAAALVLSADIRMAGTVVDMAVDIAAATTVAEAITEAAADMDGAAIMAAGAITDGAAEVGAGDLALAGRIGDMAGDIRMATTATIPGIMRPTLILIPPRRTGLRMIT
jgi:hypothetical protein